jgi:hypothetical protein
MKASENNRKDNKTGIFQILKDNLIYIIMAFILLAAIYYSTQNSEESNMDGSKLMFYLKVILVVLIVGGIFVFLNVSGARSFEQEAKNTKPRMKHYTQKKTREEYEREKQSVTEKELQKLYQSDKFRNMVREKGNDKAEWVWQTKEKEKKVVFRENESCDEDEHLSQITVSDS